jgi:hypothetical protein
MTSSTGGSSLDVGAAYSVGSRAFLARLDLELDALAAVQAVKVEGRVQTGAVEEILGPVLGRDEAEAAIRDELLYGPSGHLSTLASRHAVTLAW